MVQFADDQYFIVLRRKIERKTGSFMDVKDKIVIVMAEIFAHDWMR